MEITQHLVGSVSLPPEHPRGAGPCPLVAYVIHHPDGPILVDTGVDRGAHPRLDELYAPQAIALEEALAPAGVGIADIVLVVNTHLHFDHAGRNDRFPGVPIAVQRAELETAMAEDRYTAPWILDFPGLTWEVVDGRSEVRSGVHLLPTPSHTPGHQSVVVETAAGIEVLAGQALYDAEELVTGRSREPVPFDGAESAADVARRLLSYEPSAVWFSHDLEPWRPDPRVHVA